MSSISRKVTLIHHVPRVPELQDQRLHEVLGWNNPEELVELFIQELREVSGGLADYQIAAEIEEDLFPRKLDGFQYNSKSYLAAMRGVGGFHRPDGIDYQKILLTHNVFDNVRSGKIDEVWMMGFPYAGYYESIMVGPGAFWCNAPPIKEKKQSGRRFVVMGFNYERGLGEMLESYGHRAESIMSEVYRRNQGAENYWERFIRHEQSHPGGAEVGSIHFAPNSTHDYDWGNHHKVLSNCDAWLEFPPLLDLPRKVNCSEWGGGEIREHHRWWFRHLPRASGETNGVLNNWWSYILDPELVPH